MNGTAASGAGVALLDGLAMAAVAVDAEGRHHLPQPGGTRAVRLGAGRPRSAATSGRACSPSRCVVRVEEVLRLVLASGSWVGELAMVRADGRTSPMATSWTAVAERGIRTGALLLVEDAVLAGSQTLAATPEPAGGTASRPRPQARRLHRLSAVINELLVADSIEAVAKVVTEHMTDAAGATIGSHLAAARRGHPGAGRHPRRPRRRGERSGRRTRCPATTPAAEAVRDGEPVVLVGSDEIATALPRPGAGRRGRALHHVPAALMAAGGRGSGWSACPSPAGGGSTTPRRCSCGCSRTRAP